MSNHTEALSAAKLTHLGLLAVLFQHWSVEVLTRAIAHANDMIARRGGDIAAAHLAADEMAYGNVSLSARASMAPTAEVIAAMRKGFV